MHILCFFTYYTLRLCTCVADGWIGKPSCSSPPLMSRHYRSYGTPSLLHCTAFVMWCWMRAFFYTFLCLRSAFFCGHCTRCDSCCCFACCACMTKEGRRRGGGWRSITHIPSLPVSLTSSLWWAGSLPALPSCLFGGLFTLHWFCLHSENKHTNSSVLRLLRLLNSLYSIPFCSLVLRGLWSGSLRAPFFTTV